MQSFFLFDTSYPSKTLIFCCAYLKEVYWWSSGRKHGVTGHSYQKDWTITVVVATTSLSKMTISDQYAQDSQ